MEPIAGYLIILRKNKLSARLIKQKKSYKLPIAGMREVILLQILHILKV